MEQTKTESEVKKVIEFPEKPYGANGEATFDTRTQIRNAETSKIIAYQPYTVHFVGKTTYWERPCGSGNFFNTKGEPIGRWMPDPENKGEFKKVSEHHAVVKAIQVNKEEYLENENETLRKELAALKAEKEQKAAPKAEAKK